MSLRANRLIIAFQFSETLKCLFAVILIVFSLTNNQAYSQVDIGLTQAEKLWLQAHPKISIAQSSQKAPILIRQSDDAFTGLMPDFYRLIAQKLGVELEIIDGEWPAIVSQVNSGEIDAIGFIARDIADQVSLISSEAPFHASITFYGKSELKGSIRSLSDLENYQLTYFKNFIFIKDYFKRSPQYLSVGSESVLDGLKKVLSNEVDIYAGINLDSYHISKNMLMGVEPIFYSEELSSDIVAAVNPQQEILASIISKAFNSLSLMEKNRILSKWSWQPDSRNRELLLSKEEMLWLDNHPVIRVANSPDYPPFDFRINGKPAGFAIDYIELLSERLGFRIEYEYDTWPNLLNKAKAKDIDLLMSISKSPIEREAFLNFSRSYKSTPIAIITRKTEESINGLEDLQGKTVALIATNNAISDALQSAQPDLKVIEVSDTETALKTVSFGQADVTVVVLPVATYVIKKYFLNNLKVVAELENIMGGDTEHRIGVRKDWPQLIPMLERAMDSLTQDELAALDNRWIELEPAGVESYAGKVELSASELKYIENQKKLKFSGGQWHPLAIVSEFGEFQGLLADYLKIISDKTGLEFEYQVSKNWEQVDAKYRAGEIDMLPAVESVFNAGRKTELSNSVLSFPLVIVTNEEISFIRSTDLLNGKKVAVGKGYTSYLYLRDNFPEIELVEVEDVKTGLLKLSNHEVYAFVGHLAVAVNYIQELGLRNLKIAGETDYNYLHRIGVAKEHQQAITIINKALASMTREEHKMISNRWLPVEYDRGIDFAYVWRAAIAFVLVFGSIIAVIVIWNRRLANEIIERRSVEQKLAAARDKAEQATKAKSSFLANMSHEIRTPMNAILGYAQLMENDLQLSEDNQQIVAIINRSGKHLLGLINDVLDMSKIEAGRMELVEEPFNLHVLLEDLETMMQVNARDKDLLLLFVRAQDVPIALCGDEGKLRQVLINLLGNSIKFTESGEVAVATRVVERDDSSLLLEFKITDTGSGIPAEKLDSIFEPFSQAKGKQIVEGTGLGLPISRKIARLMNGDIQVTSQVDEGSEFIVTIELKLADKKGLAKLSTRKDVAGFAEGQKLPLVMVVDDQLTNRMLLSRILEANNINSVEASTGQEAVERFRSDLPRVILMDSVMPEMTGLEATESIRTLEQGKEAIIIAVTASTLESEINAFLAVGADRVIHKPLDISELLRTMAELADLEVIYE